MLNCKRLDIIQNHPTFFSKPSDGWLELFRAVTTCMSSYNRAWLWWFSNGGDPQMAISIGKMMIIHWNWWLMWFMDPNFTTCDLAGENGVPMGTLFSDQEYHLSCTKGWVMFLKSHPAFFSPRKKRDLKIFYPFWWTTKPGFGKRGMQKGLSWGWNNQWISRIKNGVFLCPLVRSVNLQMLGNTCDSSEPEIFRNSVGHMAFLQMRAKPSFFCWTCGSHHKPLHVTVGITMWLWLTVCHGKIHHAIKPSISMGHESIPWRTVSHNQRVTHVEIHFCLLSLRWPVYLSMHQPISMRVPRGPKESHAPMSFWHRPWWCAMS